MEGRLSERWARFLGKRVAEAQFSAVSDPRARRGRKWRLESMLKTVVVGLCAGVRSLADLEGLTRRLSPAGRAGLGLRGRLPDTTVRDLLVRLSLGDLRERLHSVIRRAKARKALEPVGLPFGYVSLDGKATAIDHLRHPLVQCQPHGGSASGASGLVRTVTSVLASSAAKVVLDVSPLPGETNEDGHFQQALRELVNAYGVGPYFRLVGYDSGACCRANADAVAAHGLWYLFRLDAKQPTLLAEAERLLGRRGTDKALAMTEDVIGTGSTKRFLFLTSEIAGWHGWDHLTVALRIRSERYDREGKRTSAEDRYYLSSCPEERLTTKQWLRAVRLRWSVENQGHNTLDTAFAEDDKPWIVADAQGMLAVLVLRRLAYTLLCLFRTVTQRSDERRQLPWRTLMAECLTTLLTATAEWATRMATSRRPTPSPV